MNRADLSLLKSSFAPRRPSVGTSSPLADRGAIRVMEDCDLSGALRLLMRELGTQMLLVTDTAGALRGVVTKTDILRAVRMVSDGQ